MVTEKDILDRQARISRLKERLQAQQGKTTYAVRHWHQVKGEDVATDFFLDAHSPDEAAQMGAAIFHDKCSRPWGPYLGLPTPVLFCLGCNSENGPDTASVEVFFPDLLPPNWAPHLGTLPS